MQRKGKKWGGKLKYNQLAALYSAGSEAETLEKKKEGKRRKKEKGTESVA